jgi:hypothetical protein
MNEMLLRNSNNRNRGIGQKILERSNERKRIWRALDKAGAHYQRLPYQFAVRHAEDSSRQVVLQGDCSGMRLPKVRQIFAAIHMQEFEVGCNLGKIRARTATQVNDALASEVLRQKPGKAVHIRRRSITLGRSYDVVNMQRISSGFETWSDTYNCLLQSLEKGTHSWRV